MVEHFDLSHLTSTAQVAAVLSNDERIQRIRSDRWIGYPRALEAIDRLEDLFSWPEKQRMPNLLIIGPTNNGKSMIIEKFMRIHRITVDQSADREPFPVLAMQMPSDPSILRFYTMLLAAMGSPIRPRARLAELEGLSLKLMRAVSVRMLVIDEFHNILSGKTNAQREFLNLIRFLGNELRIPIVGVGTQDAYLAIRSDDQLENRFEPFILPVWKEGDELASLVASFVSAFPLRRPSNLHGPDMARYILTRSEGTIGEIGKLLTASAIAAIESGEEAINNRTLALVDYASPTERRRAFEREVA